MEGFLGGLLILIISIAILVAISRWVFRINDIIKRLDQIIALMERGARKPDGG